MEHFSIEAIAVTGLVVVFILFWLDYRRSTCGYGGSNSGRDNWALRFMRHQMKSFRRFGKWLNKPKYKANEYDDFQDVFSL